IAQSNGRLMLTRRLDRRGDLDLAPVDLAEASGGDRSGNVGGLHRTEQTAAPASLDRQLHRRRLQARLEVLSLLNRGVLARSAGRLDRLDLLLATASPR